MSTNDPSWTVHAFSSLTVHDLYDLLRLRTDVFVVEQQCAYGEVDGKDIDAHHVLGRNTDGILIAYARILPPTGDGMPHIGRVVVHADHRGQGHARALMQRSIRLATDLHGPVGTALSAQAHLHDWYASLGYVAISDIYPLDGIPHVDMVRNGP